MESQLKPFEGGYCNSLTQYSRRVTIPVRVGDVIIGGDNPIVVQSMTTVDTMDTQGSVEQCIRMIDSGCQLIRITAPSLKEAENLRNIKEELRKRGYNTPLVADIHFTPNAAELAAKIVEKVRINPGNYADKKKFEVIDYTDASYAEELERIRERFLPLIKICKEHGTAMRIGTNHGSLVRPNHESLRGYSAGNGGVSLGVSQNLRRRKVPRDRHFHEVLQHASNGSGLPLAGSETQ